MPMNKVPTLLVGLGGIGCSIADMASSLLSKEDKEYVGVVGLDTNVEDLKKLKIKTIRTSDERLVKDYIIEHPEYREWFPVNKFVVGRGMMTGAGQIRAISRMAALAAIEARRFTPLEEEVKRILKHTGDKDNTAFNVFIVGSITGGTGAGLFLQMPFYIRNMLKKEYALNNIRIRGMFVSADITKNVQPSIINRNAVMVNAYACIKELNAFYLQQNAKDDENLLQLEYYEHGDRSEVKNEVKNKMLRAKTKSEFGFDLFDDFDMEQINEDLEHISSEGSNIPYDAFYLIEGTDNTGGIGNASIDTVKGQIAKMIFTLLFTPVKAEDAGILDNTILQDMEGGGMNRYSSAGMCAIRFPYEQAREYVTLRWVSDLVSQEWLLLDQLYEGEKKEAQDRQKTDPSVEIPKMEESYVRLFERESSGGEGRRLGTLRKQAYVESGNHADDAICKSAFLFRSIEDEVSNIMNQDEIHFAVKECQINMKKINDLDIADKEISRVYEELESLHKIINNVVNKSRYEIANEVFPVSAGSMELKKDSELCIYKTFSRVHPVVARFLCYNILLILEKKIAELESSLSGIDLLEYEDTDFYGKRDDGIQNASEAVAMIRNKKIPVVQSGKKPLRIVVSKFQQMASAQVQTLEEYGSSTLKLSTYRILRERFSKMAEYYASFFANIKTQLSQNEVRIGILERSFAENPYGEIDVYASPDAFRAMYQDFRVHAQFELPDGTKEAIFNGVFREVCMMMEDKNKELSEIQKQKRDEGIHSRLNSLFGTGVVDTMRTIVISDGRGIVDLSVKEAIEKELQLKTGVRPEVDADYEQRRIAYEKGLVEDAMRIAAPMFAVQDAQDITETIYMALSPEAAEQNAGEPSKGATKEHLVPERCPATDNQPVSILMEPEFSKYEIICFKAKHKYLVENLVKYRKDSEFAKAYEERINNLGKEPSADGSDAYRTVVNPHLNRYWHEEGIVPPLGAKEQEKFRKDVLKSFIYAMGMDCFVKAKAEELGNRELWYFVVGSYQVPVRQQGALIGNGYVDLYNSLRFNRKLRKYILHRSKMIMNEIKGFMDSDEMLEAVQNTWFIEDLVQSQILEPGEEDDNILDIFLKMYPNMQKDKWVDLFEGLKLVLIEYMEYMFEGNTQRINEAYGTALNRMYGYSKAGKKEIEIRRLKAAGEPIPDELELKPAEVKLKAQLVDLMKEKYI